MPQDTVPVAQPHGLPPALPKSHRAQQPTATPKLRRLWPIESLPLAFLLGGRGFGEAVVGAAAWGSGLGVQPSAGHGRALQTLPQDETGDISWVSLRLLGLRVLGNEA